MNETEGVILSLSILFASYFDVKPDDDDDDDDDDSCLLLLYN